MIATVLSSISFSTASGAHQRGPRIDRRPAQLDPEQMARFVERRVRRLRLDHVRVRDPPLIAALLAIGEHRVGDARRAAGGDHPCRLAVADRRGMEQVQGHRDDLALKPGRARAHVALQRVLMREQAKRLLQERIVVPIPAVHRPRASAALPDGILLIGDRPQLGEDLLARSTLLRKRPVDPVALGVRVAVEEVGHGVCGLLRFAAFRLAYSTRDADASGYVLRSGRGAQRHGAFSWIRLQTAADCAKAIAPSTPARSPSAGATTYRSISGPSSGVTRYARDQVAQPRADAHEQRRAVPSRRHRRQPRAERRPSRC